MAVSAIAPVGHPVSFIPLLTRLPQVTPPQALAQVVENSLTGATVAPTALTSASNSTQPIAALLEQALFNDWIASLQSLLVPSATSSFDQLLSSQLDLAAARGAGTSQSPFGLTTGVTPDLTSSIVSLFDTMQLLGTEASQAQQVGSLLDLLV